MSRTYVNVIDDNVFMTQVVQRIVVPTVLILAGIALFAYMISKGKKRQGIVGLVVCIVVALGWLAFVLLY